MYGPLGHVPVYGSPQPLAFAGGGRVPSTVRGTSGRGHPQFTEGKLFLGGVDRSVSKHAIDEYCADWGEVADSVVMDNKGYGFVTFRDPKNAMKFLETRDHVISGKKVDVKAAVPKSAGGNAKLTKKLFVGGTGELTDDEFLTHFSQFGEVEDAAIVRKEGLSRGFGFVTFADEISVEKCLVVQHVINGRKVELKRAVPKEAMPPGGYPPPVPGFAAGPVGPSGAPTFVQHPGMERGNYTAGPRGMPYGMHPVDPYYAAMAAGGYGHPYAPYGYAMPLAPGYAAYGSYQEMPPGSYVAMPASPRTQPPQQQQQQERQQQPVLLMPAPMRQPGPQQQERQQQQQQQHQQNNQQQQARSAPASHMQRGSSDGNIVASGNGGAGRQRGPPSVLPTQPVPAVQ